MSYKNDKSFDYFCDELILFLQNKGYEVIKTTTLLKYNCIIKITGSECTEKTSYCDKLCCHSFVNLYKSISCHNILNFYIFRFSNGKVIRYYKSDLVMNYPYNCDGTHITYYENKFNNIYEKIEELVIRYNGIKKAK